jgi:hypothetical protein
MPNSFDKFTFASILTSVVNNNWSSNAFQALSMDFGKWKNATL